MSEVDRAQPAPRPGGRWQSLDALRGLSILAMILVNNPGRWHRDWQFAPLRHADWHGCTFTDLVFPTFLFCAGVAIVPALQARLRRGEPRLVIVRGVLWRVVKLILLGLLLAAFPMVLNGFEDAGERLARLRLPGVLQRIGVCYGIAALLYLFTSERTWKWFTWVALLVYWPLITLVPVPGVGAPDLADPAATLQGYLDRLVFGAHIYKPDYDPEGLLSTLPAIATCLFGVEAGRVSRALPDLRERQLALLRRGALLLAIGAIWSWWLPMNKYLWTSSYTVWTAGIATVGLALAVWAFDERGMDRLAYPLRVYGTNALLVFVGSGLVGRVVATVGARDWIVDQVFAPYLPPKLASFAWALLWVGAWFVVLRWLYRRGIVWRV